MNECRVEEKSSWEAQKSGRAAIFCVQCFLDIPAEGGVPLRERLQYVEMDELQLLLSPSPSNHCHLLMKGSLHLHHPRSPLRSPSFVACSSCCRSTFCLSHLLHICQPPSSLAPSICHTYGSEASSLTRSCTNTPFYQEGKHSTVSFIMRSQ